MSTNVIMDIDRLCDVRNQHPWNTRKEYRSLRKSRPDLDLPSDKIISKEYGSFSQFQKMTSQEDSNFISQQKQKEEKDDEKIIKTIVSCLGSSFNRNQYRKFRKYNLENKLPSCTEIEKIFGSFGDMKRKIQELSCFDIKIEEKAEDQDLSLNDDKLEENSRGRFFTSEQIELSRKKAQEVNRLLSLRNLSFTSSIQVEKSKKEEPKDEVDTVSSVQVDNSKKENLNEEAPSNISENDDLDDDKQNEIVSFVRNILGENKFINRNEYRILSRKLKTEKMPSCHQIEKIFGSFTSFRNIILGRNDKIPRFQENRDWEVTPENIERWKAETKAKRQEIFGGGEREPYNWEPESRMHRFSW